MLLPDGKTFMCAFSACSFKTFSRKADFQRHYKNTHRAPDSDEQVYYCAEPSCERSEWATDGMGRLLKKDFGNRKDKCDEHFRRRHGGEKGEFGGEEGEEEEEED